jgi:hypothetical protein
LTGLTGRTNAPGGGRKQIQLQYAGIVESYGCGRSGAATPESAAPPANAALGARPYRSAIGRRYGRIFIRYLSRARLSASDAPRSKRSGRLSRRLAAISISIRILLNRKGNDMSESKLTRRGFAAAAATGFAAIGLLGASAKTADAYQGNMERALSQLHEALDSLQESTANKGGHRARAMNLVRQAIGETQAGVAFADEHGGGGN